MNKTIAAIALSIALAACGQGNRPSEAGEQGAFRDGPTCQLVAADVFAAPVEREEMRPEGDASGECRWVAQDGVIQAQLIVYDNAPAEKFDELLTAWSAQSYETPTVVEGLGDRAVLVTEMAGGQTQALVRQGNRLALILAVSGDAHITSAALARHIAESVVAHLPAPAAATP